jgi:Cu+-exporting ATPase
MITKNARRFHMEEVFMVPSITCSACSSRISSELGRMEGVSGVDIDLKTQSVRVTFDPDFLTAHDIRNKITELGYEALE